MKISFNRYELENSAVLLTEHMPYAKSVAVGIWIRYGSRSEPEDSFGAAHMIEHMLFKGTKKMSPRDIAVAFESVGGSFNAAASRETTHIYARVLGDHLPLALRLLSDMALRSVFSGDEFDREKQVVLEEIKGRRDVPEEAAFDHFMEDMFGNKGIGHAILGTEETAGGMTRDGLFDIYRGAYRPAHFIVSVTGNLEGHDVPALVSEALGPDEAPACSSLIAPPAPGSLESSINLIRRDTLQVQMCAGMPGIPYTSEDRYTYTALDMILSGGMSSRLFQEVRELRGLVYDIYSDNNCYTDTGAFCIYAGMRPENLIPVLDVTVRELVKMREGEAQKEELARVKEQFRASMIMGSENVVARMNRLARNEMFFKRYFSDEEIVDKFHGVTLDDVAAAAKKIFTKTPVVFTAMGPFDEKVRPEIKRRIVDVLSKL